MEPRPPFHHNSNNSRYGPIPPPRFSGDRSFYHHHHQRLPPPPPLQPAQPPPQPPPYRHPPQLPFPFEENPRSHVLDLERPPPPPHLPRVYDRALLDHRAPFPEDTDSRLRQPPDFNRSYIEGRSDIWDPPRVPADNRPLRPVPVDWDVERNRQHRRYNHHRDHPLRQPLMFPYRDGPDGGFVERKRFVEDLDGRLIPFREYSREGFERNQKEELFWSQSDHRGNSDNENCIGRHVVVDHHNASMTSHPCPSRNAFEFDNGRTWSSREDAVGEDRRMRLPMDVDSFVRKQPLSHHSAVMEYGDVVSEIGPSGGEHVFSGKRLNHQLKTGKFKDIVENEAPQEVICTPRKKMQRMSALLRVQLANPGKKWNDEGSFSSGYPATKKWKDEGSLSPGYTNTKKWKDEGSLSPRYPASKKWKDEGLFSSGYFDDRNASSSKSKGPIVLLDSGPEEARDVSPVELDVSFKANALVAKAITNPLSPNAGRDGCSLPNVKKRKVMLPVLDLCSPQVFEVHEGWINGDYSTQSLDIMSNLDRVIKPLNEKATVAGISAVDATVSQPCLNNKTLPDGNETVVKCCSSTMAGLGPRIKNKKKKKMLVSSSSGFENSQVAKVPEAVNAESSRSVVDATSNSKKCLTKLKGKTCAKSIRTVVNAGSHASQTAGDLPHKSGTVVGSPSGLALVSNSIGTPKVRQSKSIAPHSSLSSTSTAVNHGETVNASGLNPFVDTALGLDKGVSNIEKQVTGSGIGKLDVDFQPSNQASVPLENCMIVESLSSPIARSDTPNMERKNFIDPLLHVPCSRIEEVLEETVNSDGFTHGANAAPSSEKGFGKTDDKDVFARNRMIKGASLQSIEEINVSFGNCVQVESLSRSVVGSPATAVVKKKYKQNRKKKVLDGHLRLSSSTVKNTLEGATNEDGSIPGACSVVSSNGGVMQSNEKATSPVMAPSPAIAVVKKKKNNQNRKKKVLDGPSGLSSSTVKNTLEGVANEDGSIPGEFSVVSSDRDLTQLNEKVTDPVIGKTGDVDPASLDGVAVSHKNSERVQLLLSPMSVSDDTFNNKNDDETNDTLMEFPNSRLTELHDGTVYAGSSSSDKCIIQSGEKVTASETDMPRILDFHPLNETAVSPASNATAELPPSPVVDSNGMPKTKKWKCIEYFGLTSKVSEIHERSLNTGRSHPDTDAAITSEKDFTLSIEKPISSVIGTMDGFESQPLNTIPSLLENNVVEKSLLGFEIGSDQKYMPKVNKKEDPISSADDCEICLSISPASVIHDEPMKADDCDIGTNVASGSEVCLRQLKEKAKVSAIGIPGDISLQPAHGFSSSLENCTEEGSSMFMVLGKHDLNQEDVRKSANQSMGSNSFVGESAFPILNSPFPPELEGGWRKNNPIVTGCKSQEYTLLNDVSDLAIESEREEKIKMDEAGEHGTCNGEICDDIALHSQAQEKLDFLPLENEDYSPQPPQDELPSLSNYGSLKADATGAFIHKASGEGMEFVPDKFTNLSSQKSMLKLPESDLLNSEQLHDQLFVTSCKEHGPDEKPVDRNNSILNAKLSMSDSEVSLNLDVAMKKDCSIPEKTQPLPSMKSGKSSSFLKAKVGEFIGRKTHQVPRVPRVLPGLSAFASGFLKEPAALTHTRRPRTWRRIDNTSLPQQESCMTTGSSQSNLPKEFSKIQSNSYVRKGNSLVRKSAPSATLPQAQVRLEPEVRHEPKRSAVTESKGNSIDPANCLGLGYERSRTSPLPENSESPNVTTNSLQVSASDTSLDPRLKGGFEITPEPIVVTESNVVPKHSGASDCQSGVMKNFDTENILNSGKLKPSKSRVVYVKRKSNQLVASQNTEIRNSLISVAESNQALPSSTSCDQYYKKRKNQLIRSSPSLGSHLKQAVTVPDDSSNSESQMVPKVSSVKCSKGISKRRIDRVLLKKCKPSKFSLVWTLNGQESHDGVTESLQYQKLFPHLFPWKRTAHWRNVMSNWVSVSKKNSLSQISKKLLLFRKRDTVYTRSAGGFSLRKSKVLSIGGSNLKWSKSIEKRSKKVNEEATRAVAAVQMKKRERKRPACAVACENDRNQSSRERIFRIGSVRYKMDSSRRTLQRILDEKSPCSVDLQSKSEKDGKRSFIPKRLLIGNDEYIRIGNGNQLVRDPKKLVRILASEKVRWSLHTARMRVAKKLQYCQFFTRFGKCNKAGGKCPYIHDPAKVAVCTKFLKGLCSNSNCKLTHKVIPERMQDCSYFLQGLCSNESCPYRHVNVNLNASVCEGFLRGYCADGNECLKKHTYVCPIFGSTGVCPQRSTCKLHHPKNRNKTRKRKRTKDPKKSRGRYFGSRLSDISEASAVVASDKPKRQKSEDIFFHEGKFPEYISLDVSSEEAEDINNVTDAETKMCENDPLDLQSDELDELIKPVRILKQGTL